MELKSFNKKTTSNLNEQALQVLNKIGVDCYAAIIISPSWTKNDFRLAEKIMKRNDGLLMNLVIGIVGAILGKFLLGLMGVAYAGVLASLLAAVFGAVVLLAIINAIKGRRLV